MNFARLTVNVIGCGLENWLHLGLAWSHTHVIGMQRYQVLYLVTKREALHLIIIIRCVSRAIKDCTELTTLPHHIPDKLLSANRKKR